MKTYTFANKDEPVSAHMTGLLSALELWMQQHERLMGTATTLREAQYEQGQVDAYRSMIEVIKDSSSID